MKKTFILLFSVLFIVSAYAEKVKKKVKLPAGTIVTVRTLEVVTSKESSSPICEVSADVWDENGEFILIKEGTPADVQLITQRGSIWGDAGSVQFQPISTKAFNGRLIGFDRQKVTFSGNEDALSARKRKATVLPGTSFRAYTANDLYFTVEVEEEFIVQEDK